MRPRIAFAAPFAAFLAGTGGLLSPAAEAQTGEAASCAQRLDAQLRRLSEQCVQDLVGFTASLPKGNARIASEKDKYYIRLRHLENGLQAECVSKENFPYMKPDTEAQLKALGWTPPDVEFGGFKRSFTEADVRSGVVARALLEALRAYGMAPGEAISVTISQGDT